MLAQYGGYGSGILALLALVVLLGLVFALGGAIVLLLRRRHRQPTSSLLRAILLWCFGVLGVLYALYPLVYRLLVGKGIAADLGAGEWWANVGIGVAVLALLGGVLGERTHPGRGAQWMALLATLFGVAMWFMPMFGPYSYKTTQYALVAGVLLPLWLAAIAVWSTLPRPASSEHNRQEKRWKAVILTASLLTLGGGLLNGFLADAWASGRASKLERERLAAIAAVQTQVDQLAEAAEQDDLRAFDVAKQPIIAGPASPHLASALVDSVEGARSERARRRLLEFLASPEAWPVGQHASLEEARSVLAVVRDTSEAIDVRQAAVQVLLNWGEWSMLASELPKLGDRKQLGPAVAEFIVAAAQQPIEPLQSRALGNGADRIVMLLPLLLPSRDDALPVYIALLQHPRQDHEAVATAAQMVGNLGPAGAPALPALRAAAQSTNPLLSRYAKRAIDQIE